MAKKSKVHRPTENRAVGATTSPKPSAPLDRLWRMLAAAVRNHDRHGAQLIRNLLVRAMATGPVGATS
ncbi:MULTISPECIES: hypothetical protein [Kitasatospora]|uniref:hypothetical protein n=1 Tax=Kitasatospora TaxID=2063 RepID=UPI000C71523A|nr:hypothetical protein [Kitasatospora sp. GP30]MDH6141059.1 hypothetical protein [Kitasatospora sp. GP30]